MPHNGSGRYEFFRVRLNGALHFVKRPVAAYRNDLVTTEALKKEFYIGYNLNHPLIARYMLMEDGAVYEEYIDGLSIREMIDSDDERLHSPEFLEQVCRQLIEATSYLHSRGVIHNDIKPDNVMVSRIGNQLKLVDLGCASTDMWDATEGYTPAYKAPEQGNGDTNIYTDIFLTGRLMEELAPLAGAERRWRRFIRKATSEKTADRFSSDSEAIAAIPQGRRTLRYAVMAAVALMVVFLYATGLRSLLPEDADTPASGETAAFVAPAVTDTVISYRPESPESPVAAAKAPEKPEKPAIKEIVNADLEKHIQSAYKDYLEDCRQFAKLQSGTEKAQRESELDDNNEKILADVMAYAERLASKYPEEAQYIRMQATLLLNAQQTIVAYTMYPQDTADAIKDSGTDPEPQDNTDSGSGSPDH